MLSRLLAATRRRSSFRALYDTFVILGDPSSKPIWHREPWTEMSQRLDPIVAALNGQGVLSVHWTNSEGDDFLDRFVWGSETSSAWRLPVQDEAKEPVARELLVLELWVPGREQCDARRVFPDLFLAFRNEACLFRSAPPRFNPYLVVSIAQDLPSSVTAQTRRFAIFIAEVTKAVVRIEHVRPWGLPFGKSGYTNAIGDLMSVDVFKIGAAHSHAPSIALLEGEWKPF